jgi:hypothetical protein
MKSSVWTVGILIEIRTGHEPKASQRCYCSNELVLTQIIISIIMFLFTRGHFVIRFYKEQQHE